MPRKKQIVQRKKRQKEYRPGEMSGDVAHVKPKGAFKVFSNYRLFAIIGAVAIIGGLAFSAILGNRNTTRQSDGSIRGPDVVRNTPEPNETPSESEGSPNTVKQYPAPPSMVIDTAKSYTATIKTSKGDVTIDLLDNEAPETVNNFVFLARDGFYNGVAWHRVLPDFVAQAGDPTGTGIGGPGYTLPVEATSESFSTGLVAMAKPQSAEAENNGSQFFVMLTDEPTFDGKFTAFGKVTSGLDVLKNLTARDGETNTDGADRIESITITET